MKKLTLNKLIAQIQRLDSDFSCRNSEIVSIIVNDEELSLHGTVVNEAHENGWLNLEINEYQWETTRTIQVEGDLSLLDGDLEDLPMTIEEQSILFNEIENI